MTKEQLAKLPKWAQEEWASMKYHAKRLEELVDTMQKALPETDTVARFNYPDKMYLPKGTRVEFMGQGVRVQVHTDLEGRVRVEFDDGVIVPSGRNCIHILPNKNPKGY